MQVVDVNGNMFGYDYLEVIGINGKPKTPGGGGGPYVPYTGATGNVDLGTHTLSAKDLIINHPSGSGVAVSITKGGSGEAVSITKGGSGEALKVVKTSGSGNAASITGGVTQLDELHLTTDLADSYISSAATWNAKQNALTLTTTGTSGPATLVGSTLNIPEYAGGGGSGLQGAQIQFNNNGGQSTFGFNAQIIAANGGTGIPTSGRLDVYPVTPNKTLTNVSLTINVSTLGLGALARLVVYSNSNSFPTTKLFESTDINCSTTGDKTVLTGLTFTAGTTYWLGFYSNGIASFRTITASSMLPLFAASLTTTSIAWSRINTTLGTAPATFNYNTYSAANQINIQIRQT
jgi:hypothetical protein